jgi:hypothetical protein
VDGTGGSVDSRQGEGQAQEGYGGERIQKRPPGWDPILKQKVMQVALMRYCQPFVAPIEGDPRPAFVHAFCRT